MNRILQKIALSNQEQLTDLLIEANYAFAVWQMPNEAKSHFIISLKEPNRFSESLIDIGPGFIINPYHENHPIRPFHISADLVLDGENVRIDPRLNDSAIDLFQRKLRSKVNGGNTHAKRNNIANDQPNHLDFEGLVKSAIESIKSGHFEKVVLSRFREDLLAKNFSAWKFYKKIESSYQNAFCSMSYIPGNGLWIGATPELLASGNPNGFKTVALAGTKRLEMGQELSQIAWTQKEIEEQAFVSRYIINCFKKLRLREFHEHGPKTIKAGNLAHLKTEFEVKFNEVSFEGLLDQMLDLLHPTSAVCGMPIEKAKPWIAHHEKYDREFYAGFLGPVCYENATNLFVNLRCAKITNGRIRYYAGAGITEDSNPAKEFEETEMKIDVLRTLLKQQS